MKSVWNQSPWRAALAAFVLYLPAGNSAYAKERTVYSFSSSGGEYPSASLIEVNGTLYGTASAGGESGGRGTVFSIDPVTGTEEVIYTFCTVGYPCPNGWNPQAGVIYVNGTLYGTTTLGGVGRRGTVFSIDLNTGTERVLHSFCDQGNGNCEDGAYPLAGLIDVNGTLYGTTVSGGSNGCYNAEYNYYGCGTVFSVDPGTGVEKVIYAFCGQTNCTDGGAPIASLIDINGTLYGTAFGGKYGGGVVFSLDPNTGAERVLHLFCGDSPCKDGLGPHSSLLDVKGTLYGTTGEGGKFGGGVIFSLDSRTGVESVLYSFCRRTRCTDGMAPLANLIEDQGSLYGTTFSGGNRNEGGGGTVFALNPETGAETVLYAFCRGHTVCRDGHYPEAGLLKLNGRLYGTTNSGGSSYQGNVFSITP